MRRLGRATAGTRLAVIVVGLAALVASFGTEEPHRTDFGGVGAAAAEPLWISRVPEEPLRLLPQLDTNRAPLSPWDDGVPGPPSLELVPSHGRGHRHPLSL